MNNQQLAHRWAQANTEDSAKGSNFYFEGLKIYSYGSHYLLGCLHPSEHRGNVALINSRGYSVTTRKHETYAVRALSSEWNIIRVPKPAAETAQDHQENIKYIISKQEEAIDKIKRARLISAYIDQIENNAGEYEDYIRRFNTPRKAKFPRLSIAEMAAYRVKAAAQEIAGAKRREVRETREAALKAVDLEAWRRGENNKYFRNSAVALRRSADGLQVETSKGASVDFNRARHLYRAWMNGDDIKGLKIDDYIIIHADAETIKIGCHEISLTEARNFFDMLGE